MFHGLGRSIVISLAILVSGCSSGGGDPAPADPGITPGAGSGTTPGSTPGGTPPIVWTEPSFNSTDGHYLYYSGDGLTAVRTADPTKTVKVDTGSISFLFELVGFVPTLGSNPVGYWAHPRGVLYVKGTTLWYADAGLTPIPVVYNLDVANFCGVTGQTDFTGPASTRIVYEVRLPASTCDAADTKAYTFILSDNPNNAAVAAQHVITNTHDTKKHVDDGWLVSTSTGLYKYSLDFETSELLSAVADLYANDYLGFGVVLLTNGSDYFVYSERDMAKLFTGPIATLKAPIDALDFTQQQIAFLSDGNLYKWRSDTAGQASVLISNAYTSVATGADVRLQFQQSIEIAETTHGTSGGVATSSTTIKSYKPDGTPWATLESNVPYSLFAFMELGGALYYSFFDPMDFTKSYVTFVDPSGVSPKIDRGAIWSGATIRPGTHIGYSLNERIERVLLTKNITQAASYENAVVESFVYNTVKAQVGVLPAGFTTMFVFGLGQAQLATSYDEANLNAEVFFLNTDIADSLKRITSTPGISECPGGWFRC